MQAQHSIIRRKKIHEQLVDILVEDISSGRYDVGDQLPSERELMEKYGVGRPAVREALSKLALMGLVDVCPGVRAKVRPPTLTRIMDEIHSSIRVLLAMPRGVEQMQHVRILFETAIARSVAETITASQQEELQASLSACEQAVNDRAVFAVADVQFHALLSEFTQNTIVLGMHKAVELWLTDQRLITLHKKGQSQVALAAHQAIYTAIANHDADGAAQAMRQHLDQVHALWGEEHQLR